MGKHSEGLDKTAAKEAVKLIKAGKMEDAKRVIATISPAKRKALVDRAQAALAKTSGKMSKSDLDGKQELGSRVRKK